MKIFLIGQTKCGKTTLAGEFARQGLGVVSASQLWRDSFPHSVDDYEDREMFVKAISEFCLDELNQDPMVNVKHMLDQMDDKPCVIEGARNPFEVIKLLDPKEDHVVLLKNLEGQFIDTVFERGVGLIEKLIEWMVEARLIDPNRVHRVVYDGYDDLSAKTPKLLEDIL